MSARYSIGALMATCAASLRSPAGVANCLRDGQPVSDHTPSTLDPGSAQLALRAARARASASHVVGKPETVYGRARHAGGKCDGHAAFAQAVDGPLPRRFGASIQPYQAG
jgi:hypothetical protein